MRRSLLIGLAAAAALLAADPAGAWRLYPPDDRPDGLIVEIDAAVAEIVPLRSLPAPFDAALTNRAAGEKLSYRWRYDETVQGRLVLAVDAEGGGEARFDFAASEGAEGARYGAAVVLLGPQERPLHTFYARAAVLRKERGQAFASRGVRLELKRPPGWWRQVEAIAFFRMTYHPSQKLDDEETWLAMRRAVWRLTKGQGTEQRG